MKACLTVVFLSSNKGIIGGAAVSRSIVIAPVATVKGIFLKELFHCSGLCSFCIDTGQNVSFEPGTRGTTKKIKTILNSLLLKHKIVQSCTRLLPIVA
jgi:hypothetical protein